MPDTLSAKSVPEEYGELDVGSIKAVLVRAMITGGRVGHVRSWAYFRPVIEEEGGRLWEVREIGARGAGGTLSRCLADVEADRRDREARAARAGASAAEPAKACRSCRMAKPLTAFARHSRNPDARCHDCRDCANARRRGRTVD